MIDREKIVEDLEFCVNGHYKVELSLAKKILALLKEEPVKPVVNMDEWVCGCCGTRLERQELISPNAIFHDFFEYCPSCGKKVDWEAVERE
jgi:predicted  nucleic acid-binding Zn-ribbon protein